MLEFGRNPDIVRAEFSAKVNKERDRRWAAGTDIQIPGYGWVKMQGRPEDRALISGLAQAAETSIRLGIDQPFYFTDRGNMTHLLTPNQMIMTFLLGQQYLSDVHFAAVVLKARPDMVDDIASDAVWPDVFRG
jgi:hypothetical protein